MVKGHPLRSQNHDELKSSTLGPNLLNDFGKSKNFKNFRITPKFFFCFTIHKKLNKSCSLEKIFLFLKKKNFSLKKTLKKKFVSGTQCGRFQFIVILTPQGVSFNPVVVIGLGKNLFRLFPIISISQKFFSFISTHWKKNCLPFISNRESQQQYKKAMLFVLEVAIKKDHQAQRDSLIFMFKKQKCYDNIYLISS